MKIEHIQYKGKEYIDVFVDKSTSNGLLRFGHEITVTFLKEKDKLIFDSAWHVGVSEMSWDSSEEDSFEETFPGLLETMKNEVMKQIGMTENKNYSGACINCDYRTDPDNEGYVYCKCKESELSDGRWLMQDYGCKHTTDELYK